jgi:hypothetical protein
MNARMKQLLDRLAQRKLEEQDPGHMEILPPYAEVEQHGRFQEPLVCSAKIPSAAKTKRALDVD